MWELAYIFLALIVAYVGLRCDLLVWSICVVVLLGLLWLSSGQKIPTFEFYEDSGELETTNPVVSEEGGVVSEEGGVVSEEAGVVSEEAGVVSEEAGEGNSPFFTPSLWTRIMRLPKNALETVKPSLNHVIDSVSGKNTPDTPQPDKDGNMPEPTPPIDKIKNQLGKDASDATIQNMSRICFYLHTMKATDPMAYRQLVRTYLKRQPTK